jgi:hypothetical protein
MNHNDDPLRTLAARLGGSCPDNPQRFRETLEASLVPMIRCAIRTGTGLSPLVQWVRRHLPDRPAHDPTTHAPVMARQLCAALLQHYQARPALDTVVGR